MKIPYNEIWVAKANDEKDSVIGLANTYEEIAKIGQEWSKKHKLTHYLRTFMEVSEGEIVCERNHCYKEHFNFCPHCGKTINYKEDIF